jgi:dethiobiotin synthetase
VRGCFVTGTDTGVGKSVVAAAIIAALRTAGLNVRALKPVITGLDEEPASDWPPDDSLLALMSGSQTREEVAPLRFGPPVSPHLAGELAGTPISSLTLRNAVGHALAHDPDAVLVVEGVGGLLVPFSRDYSVRDLARDADLPIVIVARPGLGTINHTLLTIEAARGAGLPIAGVVMTPWPAEPSTIEWSNMDTVAAIGKVDVAGMPFVNQVDFEALARAGGALPLHRWLKLGRPHRY